MKHWLLLWLVLGSLVSQAQGQSRARIRLQLDPAQQHFRCRYTLRLPADTAHGPVLLNLNRQFTVRGVRSFRLGGLGIRPYFYPALQDTMQGILLGYPGLKHRRRRVTIAYEGTLTGKFATAQVMELSRNALWVPFRPNHEDSLLTYTLDVRVPPAFIVVSTLLPTRARAGRYQFRGRTATIEPTALASNNFHQLATPPPGPAVRLVKAGPLLMPDTLLMAEATRIIGYYNQSIGRDDAVSRFSVLLPSTNRNASALLDNAVNITYSDFDVRKREDRLILAHEISHKWWAYGSISSYEEWLNEAFATYSSLLYLRAAGDTTGFRLELNKRLTAAAGAPAIIGFDKATHDYPTTRRVVYDKGTAILHALHTRLSDEKFLRILAATAAQKTDTTERLLAIVAKEAGSETQAWLRELLTH